MFSSGESLHCFLVGWCTNKSYVIATSDLWLFIHASNLLPLNSPSPLPYKSWRLRAGLDVEESWPTRRQCSGAVWRHRQTVERSCPALRQFEGTWPPSFTYTDGCFTTTATGSGACSLDSQPSNMKERSMRALVQQYPRRFLKNGILRRGQADQRRVTRQ